MELDFIEISLNFNQEHIISTVASQADGKERRIEPEAKIGELKKILQSKKIAKQKEETEKARTPVEQKNIENPKLCHSLRKCSVATYIWCCLIHGNYLRSFEVTWSMHWQLWGILFNHACFGIAPAFRDSTIYFRHPEALGRPIVRFGGPWCLADGTFLKDSLQPADVKNVFGIWSVGSVMCQTWFTISAW